MSGQLPALPLQPLPFRGRGGLCRTDEKLLEVGDRALRVCALLSRALDFLTAREIGELASDPDVDGVSLNADVSTFASGPFGFKATELGTFEPLLP